MAKDNRKSNIEHIKGQLKEVKNSLENGVFTYSGQLSVGEFAVTVGLHVPEVISFFFKQGKMLNINHLLTEEQITELCLEFSFDFQKEKEVSAANFMDEVVIAEDDKDLEIRPAIVTIMGHVDHGKTTLIDNMRKSQVAEGEAGGITQHIGAYQVRKDGKRITFLDTPGHEAFTEMRIRGAKLTDIVVLVVAADDGVMPQTIEAIDHAKSSKVPIIVFVNKMDKQGADIERIKGELAKKDITAEDWGGDTQFVYGSALKGDGVEELFSAINIQAEVLELKANPNRFAIGTVIEARIDQGHGPMATLIVQNGTLYKRDFIVAGHHYGRIRTMKNSNGEDLDIAYPGTPVIVSGLNYSPSAGDKFFAFKDEKFAKNLAEDKAFEIKQQEISETQQIRLDDGLESLNIIIKSDVQGTAEAIKGSLQKIKNEEIKLNIIRSSVGAITKSDVLLASASKATIVGFNIKPIDGIGDLIKTEGIQVNTYSIIYKLIDDVKDMLQGLLKPKYEEEVTGQAQILKVIHASKFGNIAGSKVISGTIFAGSQVRLLRKDVEIVDGKLDSLQRGTDQAKKVLNGFEFGCHIRKFDDIKVDDIIEAYHMVEIKR